MQRQLWHVTFASGTRHALFPGESLRRRALRKVIAAVARELVLYSVVDDHLHLVLLCSAARAAIIQRSIQLILRPMVMGTIKVDCRSVEGRSHLMWLVRYLLTQVEKHQLKVHPALWSGSCFQELVGARCGVGLRRRLGELLPRLPRGAAQQMVGLPRREIQPCSDGLIKQVGVGRVVAAAAAALLVGPELAGRSASVMLAKRAVAQLGQSAGIGGAELNWLFKESPSTVRRWRRPAVDQSVLQAIRIRLALEEIVAQLAPRVAAAS